MDAGLLLSAAAELTGEDESTLTLLLEGWDDDDDDDDDDEDDVWAPGRVAALD